MAATANAPANPRELTSKSVIVSSSAGGRMTEDWYLQLMAESNTTLNIGFVKPDHELFAGRTASSGTYGVVLTIHVDDVDEAYKRAKKLGAEIAAEIRNEDMASAISSWSTPTGWC